MDRLYEGFAREQVEASRDASDIDYFSSLFTDRGKFKGTKENLEKIKSRAEGDLAEDFNDYVSRQRQEGAAQGFPSSGSAKGSQAIPAQGTAGSMDARPADNPSGGLQVQTPMNDFVSGLGIDPARLDAERQNIRDMHYKQLAADEASSGNVPRLDRAINSDYAKAAGNMAMAGYQGAKGWERGILGARLEAALQDPATAQQAQEAIRQMQAEDEAAYFGGDVHVQEGAGKSRKPVLIRSRDGGLTKEAQQKYFQKDWQNFADREGYRPSGQPAPHTTGGAQAQNEGQAVPGQTMGQPSASQVQQMQVPAETPQGQQSNAIPQPAGEVQAIARETSPRPAERAGRAGGEKYPRKRKTPRKSKHRANPVKAQAHSARQQGKGNGGMFR